MKYNQSNILVFNCGSSSLKYKIIRMPEEEEIIVGEAERVGIKTGESSFIDHCVKGQKRKIVITLNDHCDAFREIIRIIKDDFSKDKSLYFDVCAHRYVHPGNSFKDTTKIDDSAVKRLKLTLSFAPIHNPIAYNLIVLCRDYFPDIEQFVIFDTAFHKTIPDEYSRYALPRKLAQDHKFKRIGFHGISHKYVSQAAALFLGKDILNLKMLSCHLGTGGSSVCAIKEGKSINTSMGFTPLEGLVMNTRCGDIDAAMMFSLVDKYNISAEDAETMLNKLSGVLGVYDLSSDLRDVIKNIDLGQKATLALDIYVNRIKKYLGYYSLILKKADVLIFTDSIGLNVPLIREKICQGLEFFGISIDKGLNYCDFSQITSISNKDSETKILVVPTNEELMIAREAFGRLKNVACC